MNDEHNNGPDEFQNNPEMPQHEQPHHNEPSHHHNWHNEHANHNETPTPVEQPAPEVTSPVLQPQTPVLAPSQAPGPNNDKAQSGTVVLVWQWLTYGLWAWTLGALSVLISSTLAYFIVSESRNNDQTWLVYIIATTLCLLPISYLIDRVYSKSEPPHKHGFAAVILVIHAVFAFLVSIGALITAVVTILSLATDVTGDSSTKLTVIASAFMIAILGALFFVRIVQPAKLAALTRKFRLIVTIVAAVTVIAALAGPYVATIGSKQDRQIEAGLSGINESIQSYARDNKKLPTSLGDLTFDTYEKSSETLAKSNLVSYSQKSSSTPNYGYSSSYSRTLNYELCVTYKKSAGNGKLPNTAVDDNSYTPSSYLSTYSHPAGKTCYQQAATITLSNNNLFDGTTKLQTTTN